MDLIPLSHDGKSLIGLVIENVLSLNLYKSPKAIRPGFFSTSVCILIQQPEPGGYYLWSLAQRPDKLKKSPTVILLGKRDRERERENHQTNNGDCETLSVFTFFNSVKAIGGVIHPQCSACV